MGDAWSIQEASFDAGTARAYEGLFTQGSGYLHVRGSLEEHFDDAPQNVSYTRMPANVTSEKFPETLAKWGTYVPGIFGRHPLLNREMINLPWFLGMAPIVDGERLNMETSRITDYIRTLDLHTATLRRSLTWHTRSGAVISVFFERFLSAARPGLCLQRMILSSDREVTVTVRAGIDADVRTNGFDHFTEVEFAQAGGFGLDCRVRTDNGDEVLMRSLLVSPPAEWRYEAGARSAELATELTIPAGGEVLVEKRTAVTTSRDPAPCRPAEVLAPAEELAHEMLHEEHAACWRERWERSDVVIEGHDTSQFAMRVSLYHLLRAHATGDCRVAIDAKGYAGDAYFGRFFWDTEMYLLPFFLYTDPARARTLVDFRIHTLPGARDNARQYGYPGARYAWESDNEGHESCALWQYRDHEVHVTADVVYGMAHYARAVNDPDYLAGPAAEVILQTARYWRQRVDWRFGDAHPSLLGVMGPDEYNPISSNNSYTNRLVAFVLALAAEIGPRAGATPEECAAFTDIAATLPLPRAQEGRLVLQCEGFDRQAEPHFDDFWIDRASTFAAQVSQERLYRSKCLKQADVLMLMMLFPTEFTDEEVRCAWEYYLPYTTHDSSLSAGAHAIIAARLEMIGEAWTYWQRSSGLDLDLAHGGASEGIHIANAGANWQVAVFGFAGLTGALHADILSLRPSLPMAWTRLAFPLVWKGIPVYVDISASGCTLANHGDRALEVRVYQTRAIIPAGESASFLREDQFPAIMLN